MDAHAASAQSRDGPFEIGDLGDLGDLGDGIERGLMEKGSRETSNGARMRLIAPTPATRRYGDEEPMGVW